MSIPPAWLQVLNFFGAPLVAEPSPGQLSGDEGLLPIRQFDQRVGLTRAFAEALDDPRDPDLTEHSPFARARARVVGIFAGYQDPDRHGNRLDSRAAQRSGAGGKEQEWRTWRASVEHPEVSSGSKLRCSGLIDRIKMPRGSGVIQSSSRNRHRAPHIKSGPAL
jgi:hypothetical protein